MLSRRVLAQVLGVDAKTVRLENLDLVDDELEIRVAVTSTGPGAIEALDRWISWAQRFRIPSFVRLARRIRGHRPAIVATIEHRLTNALVESFNTKIRLIARRAFGFHHVDALIALARLTLSGQRPPLPT